VNTRSLAFLFSLAVLIPIASGCTYSGPRPFNGKLLHPFNGAFLPQPVNTTLPYGYAPGTLPAPNYPIGGYAEAPFNTQWNTPGIYPTGISGPACTGCNTNAPAPFTAMPTGYPHPVRQQPYDVQPQPYSLQPQYPQPHMAQPILPQTSYPGSYGIAPPNGLPSHIVPGSERLGQPTIVPPPATTGPKVELLPQPMPSTKSKYLIN